jgi:hypothetical protein
MAEKHHLEFFLEANRGFAASKIRARE